MSLFGDSRYIYRDTFFVYIDAANRPTTEDVKTSLAKLGSRYELVDSRPETGRFEAVTFRSPYDFSAMDITYVEGEEVAGQIQELMEEFKTMTLAGDDHKKLAKLQSATARLDLFHFEQVDEGDGTGEEMIDPGGLLLVLEKLCELCDGVGLDPQSNTLM